MINNIIYGNSSSGGGGDSDFYVVIFKNPVDGSVYQYKECEPGGSVTYTGTTPTKAPTSDTAYTFSGWSSTQNGSAEKDILTNITSNKIVWAAYTSAVRNYTVTWKNFDGTTLKTENYAYGETPKYTGDNPTYLGWTFTGWNPTPAPITSSMTYYATYSYPAGMTETINKDWDQIIADAKSSSTSGYTVLGTKIMATTDNKARCYELAGIKADSGSTFTFIPRTVDGTVKWNTSDTNSGGYPKSNYKTYIEGTCLNHFPANIKAASKSVSKTYRMGSGDNKATNTASYTIWPPSVKEMNWTNTSSYNETSGVTYTAYTSDSQRIRYTDTGSASAAWLRSAYYLNTSNAMRVYTSGVWNIYYCSNEYGALPCFCL